MNKNELMASPTVRKILLLQHIGQPLTGVFMNEMKKDFKKAGLINDDHTLTDGGITFVESYIQDVHNKSVLPLMIATLNDGEYVRFYKPLGNAGVVEYYNSKGEQIACHV
jgi:hypothetical protein